MNQSIRLIIDACTSCDLCQKQCPDTCIEITSHNEQISEEGARRPRSVAVLDEFTIDFSKCMYCGICIEVCPFDALEWSDQPIAPTSNVSELLYSKEQLAQL